MVSAIDVSNFPTSQASQPNILQSLGQYQSLANAQQQNQLLQQNVQQAKIATQQAQGQQRVAQIIGDNTNDNGHTDWLKVKSDSAKDPLASMNMDYVNKVADPQLALTSSGVVPAGQPGEGTPISKPLQQIQESTSGSGQGANSTIPTGIQPGFTTSLPQSRKNYNDVNDAATSAPDRLASFGEIADLNDAGAKTGTSIANMYQKLAQTAPALFPQSVTDTATQTQMIAKYIHRVYADNLPSSDARAGVLESSQISPDQLSSTIHELLPFMKASTQGLIAKQKYYNDQTKNGTDLSNEPLASQKWNQNYDPRLIEYDSLPDADAKKAFLRQHQDMASPQFKQRYQSLQNMGVVKGK